MLGLVHAVLYSNDAVRKFGGRSAKRREKESKGEERGQKRGLRCEEKREAREEKTRTGRKE